MANQVTPLWQHPSLPPKIGLPSRIVTDKKHRYLRHESASLSLKWSPPPHFYEQVATLTHARTQGKGDCLGYSINTDLKCLWLFYHIPGSHILLFLGCLVEPFLRVSGVYTGTQTQSTDTKTLYFWHERSHFGLGARGQASRPQEQTQQQFSRSQISGKHGKDDEAESYFCGCLKDIKSHKA